MAETRCQSKGRHRFSKRTPAALADPLLYEWADWMRVAGRSELTIKKFVGTVDRFARETENVGVSSACHTDILRWFAANDHLAPQSAAGYFECLHAFYTWLQRMGYRADDPMARMGKPKRVIGVPRPAADADLVRTLGGTTFHKTRVMILLAALAGLRVHEVAKVKGEDIDAGRSVIWVLGKGKKLRSVPLHPLLITAAQTMPTNGWWFPSRERPGKPVNASTVTFNIRRAMRRAGVGGTPHALRHWFASSLLANGADLRTVQELMRHQSVVSTQLYTLVPGERQHEAVATLDPWKDTRAALFGSSR